MQEITAVLDSMQLPVLSFPSKTVFMYDQFALCITVDIAKIHLQCYTTLNVFLVDRCSHLYTKPVYLMSSAIICGSSWNISSTLTKQSSLSIYFYQSKKSMFRSNITFAVTIKNFPNKTDLAFFFYLQVLKK